MVLIFFFSHLEVLIFWNVFVNLDLRNFSLEIGKHFAGGTNGEFLLLLQTGPRADVLGAGSVIQGVPGC